MVSLIAIFIFVIHCPNVPMAGVTAPYQSGLMEEHQLNQYKQLYEQQSTLRRRDRYTTLFWLFLLFAKKYTRFSSILFIWLWSFSIVLIIL